MSVKGVRTPPEKRFWAKVRKTRSCWIWEACKDAHGYGAFTVPKLEDMGWRTEKAHRLAWKFTYGEEPGLRHVLHRCDNPSCVNPDHLFLGTHQDNMKDMVRKNRHAVGERSGASKLTEEEVLEIRSSPETATKLAKKYGVDLSTVCKVRRRVHWAHV